MIKKTEAKGVLIYLKTVNGIRRTLMGVMTLFFVFQVVVLSFFSTLVFSLWLAPWELETKLWIGLGVSFCLFFIPFCFFTYMLQEKIWYKVSQAEQWLDKIEDQA